MGQWCSISFGSSLFAKVPAYQYLEWKRFNELRFFHLALAQPSSIIGVINVITWQKISGNEKPDIHLPLIKLIKFGGNEWTSIRGVIRAITLPKSVTKNPDNIHTDFPLGHLKIRQVVLRELHWHPDRVRDLILVIQLAVCPSIPEGWSDGQPIGWHKLNPYISPLLGKRLCHY